jgi:hypothetical protein
MTLLVWWCVTSGPPGEKSPWVLDVNCIAVRIDSRFLLSSRRLLPDQKMAKPVPVPESG